MTEILLARHGETDWNRDERWQGHADPPLNERGRRQARELAARLACAPPTAVYASDLARARETAEIVAAELGLTVRLSAALREVDVGSWSGLTFAEISERFPAGAARLLEGDHGWDDGESYEALRDRTLPEVERIAAAHPAERVLVVTHGAVIRSLVAHAEGITLAEYRRAGGRVVGNCGTAALHVGNGTIGRLD